MDEFKVGSVPEHFLLPWHLASERGDFERMNLDVRWQDYPGGTGAMMADLRSGELDIAIALTEGVVADIVQQQSGKIAQVFINSPLTWGIHVAANSSYQKVEDLEGKTFAVSRLGSGSHLMAFVMAKQLGWETGDLQLEIVGGMDGARQALPEGKADAFMWEKYMTKPVVDRGEFRRIGEFDTPWPCFVVVVRNEILESHLAPVRTLLEVVQQSTRAFIQQSDATSLVAQRFELQPKDAKRWFDRTRWQSDFKISGKMLSRVMVALIECDIIDSSVVPQQLCSQIAILE